MRKISKLGKAILILAALTFAADLRAQPSEAPPSTGSRAAADLLKHRIAEREWNRGYRDGYELGLSIGFQDAKAFLPPIERPPGQDIRTRLTPYRQGYAAGYTTGYRRSFYQPWHWHP